MRQGQRAAFSIIELSVALVIVAALVAILLPTVAAARRASRVTRCASNLRQIGQALFAYRAQDRVWPTAAPIPPPFTFPGEAGSPSFPQVLVPYLKADSAVYHCPGDDQQVYAPCAAVPGGSGISYVYEVPFHLPPPYQTVMTDFQGYAGPTRSVSVHQFHPPQMGTNALRTDGSVDFGYANPGGP